jgi:predicted dehydrogenase
LDENLASANRQYPRDTAQFYDEEIPIEERHAVNVYTDFAQAIRTGGEPYVKPAHTLVVMQMLERARKAAREIIVTPIG